mgnify:CR=1 FL=1
MMKRLRRIWSSKFHDSIAYYDYCALLQILQPIAIGSEKFGKMIYNSSTRMEAY